MAGAASTALLGCGGDGLLLPGDAEPAALAVVAGNNQTAQVSSTLADAVVVRVVDGTGRPVSGARVEFRVTSSSGGSISPATVTTSNTGEAAAQWSLGSAAGPQTATATVQASSLAPVELTAFAAAGVASKLEMVQGDDQTAPVGTTLAESLVVRATDAAGNPVEGLGVSWTAESGGSVTAPAVGTGPDGRAGVRRTLGPAAGEQSTVASASGVPGSPVVFTATATTGAAGKLTLVTQPSATATNGEPFAEQPRVQLVDAFNNPVASAGVAVAVGLDGHPSGVELNGQRTAATDESGVARFDGLSLAGPPGSYALRFTGASLADVVSRAIALQSGPISAGGSSVSATPASIVAIAETATLTVTVRDELGFAVPGATVTPAAIPAGGSFEPGDATTDASGVATFRFRGSVAGTYRLSARAGSVELSHAAEVVVTRAATATVIVSDAPDPSGLFVPLTVGFSVTSSVGGPLDGTVTVQDVEAGWSCAAPVGAGSCDLRFGGLGDRTLVAVYSGDGAHQGSTSGPEPHVVQFLSP